MQRKLRRSQNERHHLAARLTPAATRWPVDMDRAALPSSCERADCKICSPASDRAAENGCGRLFRPPFSHPQTRCCQRQLRRHYRYVTPPTKSFRACDLGHTFPAVFPTTVQMAETETTQQHHRRMAAIAFFVSRRGRHRHGCAFGECDPARVGVRFQSRRKRVERYRMDRSNSTARRRAWGHIGRVYGGRIPERGIWRLVDEPRKPDQRPAVDDLSVIPNSGGMDKTRRGAT
jgi:hypothetical protein